MKPTRVLSTLFLCLAPALSVQADLVLPSVPATVPGAPPPDAQRLADEWVLVRIVQVQREGANVRAVGVVLREFVTQSGLKIGDVIYIDYAYRPPAPSQLTEGRTPYVGFGTTPPLLTGGEVTYAYLRQTDQWMYAPAAGAWSFAPPVGLWPEVVTALSMDFTENAQRSRPAAVARTQSTASLPERMAAAVESSEPAPGDATITVFLEGLGESYVRVHERQGDAPIYEGRLLPGTYVGVSGVPPLKLESTNYATFVAELPNRQSVQLYPGSDYGMLTVPLQTNLEAPELYLDLGTPPTVYTAESEPTVPESLVPLAETATAQAAPAAAPAPSLRERAPEALTFEAYRLRQQAPPTPVMTAPDAGASLFDPPAMASGPTRIEVSAPNPAPQVAEPSTDPSAGPRMKRPASE